MTIRSVLEERRPVAAEILRNLVNAMAKMILRARSTAEIPPGGSEDADENWIGSRDSDA